MSSQSSQINTGVSSSIKLQYVDSNGNTQNLPFPIPIDGSRGGQTNSRAIVGRYPTGRVMWFEDFEAPGSLQNWWTIDGDLYRRCRSSLRSRTGRYSLHIHCNQSNTINDIGRTIALDSPSITKLGLEWWMSFSHILVPSTNSAIGMSLEHWDGTKYNEWQAFYRTPANYYLNWDNTGSGTLYDVPTAKTLSAYDPSGSATVIGYNIAQTWHHWKLIANISTNKWVSLYVNNQFFDLTSLNLGVVDTGSLNVASQDTTQIRIEPHLIVNNYTFTPSQSQPAEVFYDDIILTDES